MARWTKKRIAEQLAWSDACYREALLHHYDYLLSKEDRALSIRQIKRVLKEKLETEQITAPEVNTDYLNNLRQLDTEKLELIVEAYNKGKQYRSANTIDVLLSELFERATNPSKRKI